MYPERNRWITFVYNNVNFVGKVDSVAENCIILKQVMKLGVNPATGEVVPVSVFLVPSEQEVYLPYAVMWSYVDDRIVLQLATAWEEMYKRQQESRILLPDERDVSKLQ